MAFDYKKEYKEFYMPKNKPSIVTVPRMNFIAVRGEGDPNAEDGAYKQAIGLLYGIAFTIKMSKKGDHQIEGYCRLFSQGELSMDIRHPSARFRDKGGFRLGNRRSDKEEENRLFQGGVFYL